MTDDVSEVRQDVIEKLKAYYRRLDVTIIVKVGEWFADFCESKNMVYIIAASTSRKNTIIWFRNHAGKEKSFEIKPGGAQFILDEIKELRTGSLYLAKVEHIRAIKELKGADDKETVSLLNDYDYTLPIPIGDGRTGVLQDNLTVDVTPFIEE